MRCGATDPPLPCPDDEGFRAAVDPGANAHLLQECHQPGVADGVIVCENFTDIARVREPLALGHPQEEPCEPVREVATDDQQVAVLELVKELLRRQMLRLQRTDELEHVLVGQHISGRRGEPPEQVVDHSALQLTTLDGQVRHAVRRVGDHLGHRLAAIPLEIHGPLEQRVEGGRHEQVELADPGQLLERGRGLELDVAHDRAQARVGFLTPTALP